MPSTESQCLPAAGGVFAGHLNNAPSRAPAGSPLRSGCSDTREDRAGRERADRDAALRRRAEPAISTAQTIGLPSASRSTFLRSSFIGAKKICRWFASGFTRVTTPVKVFVWLASKIENEWCAYTGTATTVAAVRVAATRPPAVRLLSIITRLLCL